MDNAHSTLTHSPVRATLWAMAIAAALLVITVLPAEYGIDWTGAGRLFGLTAMGERKMAEAKAHGVSQAAPSVAPTTAKAAPPATYSTVSAHPLRHDEINVQLAPKGEVEYKTLLQEGEFLVFSWDAGGAEVKFDFHGEPTTGPKGAFLTFHKGSAAKSGGSLHAPFSGTHGWYWKNTTEKPVVIKLKVSGFYSEIKRM